MFCHYIILRNLKLNIAAASYHYQFVYCKPIHDIFYYKTFISLFTNWEKYELMQYSENEKILIMKKKIKIYKNIRKETRQDIRLILSNTLETAVTVRTHYINNTFSHLQILNWIELNLIKNIRDSHIKHYWLFYQHEAKKILTTKSNLFYHPGIVFHCFVK